MPPSWSTRLLDGLLHPVRAPSWSMMNAVSRSSRLTNTERLVSRPVVVVHDEILNIRRKKQAEDAKKTQEQLVKEKKKGEHYAIPHGTPYEYISSPNYFCEWLWFALAASPLPNFEGFGAFPATITPPFLSFAAEVFWMAPRAVRGHQWYHGKFPNYPKERRAVVPFIL